MPFPIATAARPTPVSLPAAAPPPPPPDFLETLAAGARVGADETRDAQQGRLLEAYDGLAGTLGDLGVDRGALTREQPWYQIPAPGGSLDRDKVWRAVDAARRRDPALFKGLPATRDEYELSVLRRGGGRTADEQALAASDHGFAGFLGRSASDMGDSDLGPLQFSAGVGASSIWVSMLKNGVLNATLEGVKTPERMQNREALAEPMNAGEVAANIGGAFVFGAGLTGAGHAGVKLAGAGVDAARGAFERAVAAHWERLPAGLRTRWEARASIEGTPAEDALIADLAEAVIGREHMSEAEAGAAAILRAQAQHAAGNPFVPDGAGLAAHDRLQAEALQRIIADHPGTQQAPPLAPPLQGRGETAISTGVVPGDAISLFMARTRHAESGGSDTAAAASSSAYGRYQFTRGTWLRFYQRRFGTGGLSREQILAKRSDGRLQDVLMRDLTEHNAAVLREHGVPVTPGNLYLLHFAGEGDGIKLLAADPAARAKAVMERDSVAANPFLERMSVGEVLAWADRKMGGAGVPVRGGGATIAADVAGDEAGRLRAEIDALHAENARIEAELSPEARALVEVDDKPVPVDLPELPENIPENIPPEPRAFDPDAPPAEVLALLPSLREVIADRKRSLNQIDRLAKELGASPEEVRRGLTVLTREGRIAMRRDTGAFMRKPPPLDGPQDVLEFLAAHGGIRDDEGHGLGLIRQEGHFAGERGGRDWQRMTRRNGPLLRRNGKSIDDIGEALWEAGYLRGRDSERPTTREVLEYLDERIQGGKPAYPMGEQPSIAGAEINTPDRAEAVDVYADWIADEAERVFGVARGSLDPEFLAYAAGLKHDLNLPEGEAFMRAVNDYAQAVQDAAFEESGGVRYEDVDYDWPHASETAGPAGEAVADEGDFAGFEPDTGDAPAGAGGGRAAGDDREAGPQLADLAPEERTRFLDPDGADAQAQATSLEHDARMVVGEESARDFAVRIVREGKTTSGFSGEGSYSFGQKLSASQSGPHMTPGKVHVQLDGERGKIYTFDEKDIRAAADGVTKPVTLDSGAAVDPAIAARQRQEAELRAQAPMRGENKTGQAQDGTMGLGLFDSADQPTFRLDVDGEAKPLKSLLDEIDQEAAEIKAAQACIKPPGGTDGA